MPTFILYIAVIIYTTYLLHNIYFFFPKFHWLVIDSGPCWWSLWEVRIFLFLLLFILRLFVILFSFVFPRLFFFYSRTFQFISPIIPFLVSSRLFGPVSCVFLSFSGCYCSRDGTVCFLFRSRITSGRLHEAKNKKNNNLIRNRGILNIHSASCFFFSFKIFFWKCYFWLFHFFFLYTLKYLYGTLTLVVSIVSSIFLMCVFWFVMETRSVFNVFLGGSFETICAIFRLISRTNITRRYLEKMAKDDERRKLYIHPSQSIIHPLKKNTHNIQTDTYGHGKSHSLVSNYLFLSANDEKSAMQ
jgi:hypothetical protein